MSDLAGPGKRGDKGLQHGLQEALGEAYVIDRELTGGGMSRVFLADEVALHRKVVVKVLPQEMSLGLGIPRFQREIQLAAQLQHPHIVPVLTANAAAGLLYYTMPFVAGESLRARIAREGTLLVKDAVAIWRDVLEALACAHASGIVHRDIKPGNVLLSGRAAAVTDFGIAKALGEARVPGESETLTQAGAGIGTPAYMAPEQFGAGGDVDHRIDIYAAGLLMYEMLAGQGPFTGLSMAEIMMAQLARSPAPLAKDDVPPALAALVFQCLEKDPARRPQSAAEVLEVLENVTAQPVVRARRGPRKPVVAGIGIAAAAVTIAAWFTFRTPPRPVTLGAVPFLNLAHDTALDYLSDGISDEILTAMGKDGGVEIIGRNAAYRYKGRSDVDPPTVARELGVRILVTGTLREDAGQVIVYAQLNDSATRGELWSGKFSRDRKDFGLLTDDIVHALIDTLRARLPRSLSKQNRAVSTTGTSNSQALDLYLVGQELLKRRGAGVQKSVENFERALVLDPTFARAHAALAMALTFEPFFLGTFPAQLSDRIISESKQALALDPTLADAHTALGQTYADAGQWEASDGEFRRALALEPENFEALHTWARNLVARGEISDGLVLLARAHKVEPVSPLVSSWTAAAFFLSGRVDSALAEIEQSFALDSTLLPTMEKASLRLAAGDTAGALSAIEQSARTTGAAWTSFGSLLDPMYDPVRQSPRFAALLRQANLDVRLLTAPHGALKQP
jgi:eukaryotic-like serine/threonine-protein kinase